MSPPRPESRTSQSGARPAAWLLKTEPGAYSFDDLVRERRTAWDGVTNPVALRNLRAMRTGDRLVIYHTGKERRAVGFARVARPAYPDPKQHDVRMVVVDIEAGEPFRHTPALSELKSAEAFADSPLVRQGRLSVVPLSRDQLATLESLGRGMR